jgi:hypothetical protein
MTRNNFLCKLIIILVILLVALTAISAVDISSTYKVILPNTNLYEDADFNSDVLAVMPQNAIVTLDGDAFYEGEYYWQKVSYNSIIGYMLYGDLFESCDMENYTIEHGKARSLKIGEDINLYISNDTTSTIAYVLHDGEKLNIISNDIDYGNFELVEYEGENYFASKANVTTALSLNEEIALIIGLSALGIILVVVIIYTIKKRKKLYNSKL